MNDNELQLKREIQELKAEVRRLRRAVESAFVVAALVAVVVCPQLLVLVASIVILSLFAFLVSPVRGMIFSSFFRKSEGKHNG